MNIKKGDQVIVISGEYKGSQELSKKLSQRLTKLSLKALMSARSTESQVKAIQKAQSLTCMLQLMQVTLLS